MSRSQRKRNERTNQRREKESTIDFETFECQFNMPFLEVMKSLS